MISIPEDSIGCMVMGVGCWVLGDDDMFNGVVNVGCWVLNIGC